jgi:hypothetical protein
LGERGGTPSTGTGWNDLDRMVKWREAAANESRRVKWSGGGRWNSVHYYLKHEKTRPKAGSVVQGLLVPRIASAFVQRFDSVFHIRDSAVDARFHLVYAILHSLEATSYGDGDIVAVLVNETLDLFEVFLI